MKENYRTSGNSMKKNQSYQGYKDKQNKKCLSRANCFTKIKERYIDRRFREHIIRSISLQGRNSMSSRNKR